jgi:hypothetical protein
VWNWNEKPGEFYSRFGREGLNREVLAESATQHPAVSLEGQSPNFFRCPYSLEEYSDRPAAVMLSRPITSAASLKTP